MRPLRDWHADARIFKIDPPIEDCSKVIVIANRSTLGGYDMMIWGMKGEKIKYGLLKLYRSTVKDHTGALKKIGCKVEIVRTPR